MTNRKASFENWLDPDKLRPNLIAVSLYIAAFELLKASIVDRLKDFFSTPGCANPDAEYVTEVLSRNASPLYASLSWLKELNVISDADAASFERIKRLRNSFAHAITGTLTDGLPPEFAPLFAEMNLLLTKIERWWIINVDVTIDPPFDGKEIDENVVMPGSAIALRIIMDVALGPDSEAKQYIDAFRSQKSTESKV